MVKPSKQPNKPDIPTWIARILEAEQLSRQDYCILFDLCLDDNLTTPQERQAINRVFDALQLGQVHFLD